MADFSLDDDDDTEVAVIESSCAICLGEYLHGADVRRSFHCLSHVFHNQCILDWLVHQSSLAATPQCPCCLRDFVIQNDYCCAIPENEAELVEAVVVHC
jgi:hypothetical protein